MPLRRFLVALLALAPALGALAAEKDIHGDLMPEGAKARLGTPRLRVQTYAPPVLAPDGKSLFVQSSAGLQRLDPATGAALAKPAVQVYGGTVVVSEDGKRVAVGSANGATVADLASGKVFAKIERRLPGTDAVGLTADGRLLALGAAGDGIKREPLSVLLWDVGADREVRKLPAVPNDSANVFLAANGRTLAVWGVYRDPEAKSAPDAATDPSRVVTLFDVAGGKEQARFRSAGSPPAAVVLSPDGALAAVAAGNSTVELIDAKTGALKHLLLGRSRIGKSLSFSPDGTTLAATAEDGAAQRWKTNDGSRLSTTEPPGAGLTDARVRLLAAERGVAWAVRGAAAVVWEVPSGKLVSTDGGHTTAVRGLAVTADGKHVVTSADDGALARWELATGKPLGPVALRAPDFGYTTSIGPAALSSGAARALARDSAGVGVYDLASGAQQYVIPTAADGWSQATFSPDGARIVLTSFGYDPKKVPARVGVWDAAAGKRLGAVELPGYRSVVAAVTPDGKFLVTAGLRAVEKGQPQFVVTGWDAVTGVRRGEHVEEGGNFQPYAATAPDNVTAAVVTARGRVIAFDVTTGRAGAPLAFNRFAPSGPPVFSPDGKRLALAGPSEPGPAAPLVVLDWPSGAARQAFVVPGGVPGVMAFAPDGKALVTGSPDTTAIVWDTSK